MLPNGSGGRRETVKSPGVRNIGGAETCKLFGLAWFDRLVRPIAAGKGGWAPSQSLD